MSALRARLRVLAVGVGSILDLSGQATLRRLQAVTRGGYATGGTLPGYRPAPGTRIYRLSDGYVYAPGIDPELAAHLNRRPPDR